MKSKYLINFAKVCHELNELNKIDDPIKKLESCHLLFDSITNQYRGIDMLSDEYRNIRELINMKYARIYAELNAQEDTT